jgi:hypothetical protein
LRLRSWNEDFSRWVEHPPVEVVLLRKQTLSLVELGTLTFRDASPTISITSDSGLASVVRVKSGLGTIEGNKLTIQGAGLIVLEAQQDGNEVYAPAVQEFQLTVAKRSQTISFIKVPTKVFGTTPVLMAASTDSGLTVSYKWISGPGSVTGNRLTINGAGKIEVEASQTGSENYLPASVRQTIDVQKAPQTITFNTLTDRLFTTNAVPLVAISSSKLPVGFEIVTSETARIDGANLFLLGVGSVTVRAQQIGNENYESATTVDRMFQVRKGLQTISFNSVGSLVYGVQPVKLLATGTSGLPITFKYVDGPGIVTNGFLVVTGSGTINIQANQSGDERYESASSSQSVTVAKADQTISFSALSDIGYTTNGVTLNASSTSSLKPTFRASGPATVNGDVLRLTGVGTVQVVSDQVGNADWNAARSVTNNFIVSRGTQTINFPPIPDQVLSTGPLVLAATSSSGLPVTYSLISGKATVTLNTVTFVGEGPVIILARQIGSALWLSAQQEQSFTIRKMANLSVAIAGNIGGTVSVDPKRDQYVPSESVTLNAIPGEGFVFGGWSGSLSGSNNPQTFVIETNRAVIATFKDTGKPVLSWLTPQAGITGNEQVRLAGAITDNAVVTQASWRRDSGSTNAITLGQNGVFSIDGITLSVGTNQFTIEARDAAGNTVSELRTVVWEPARVLKLADAKEVQEGQRISFPLTLSTPGDVAGLTFRLNYDEQYLTDPKVDLSAVVGQSVNSINIGTIGVISGSFALAGIELPTGIVPVATVSFRARSVPMVLSTEVAVAIDSLSSANGTTVSVGNATVSGWGRIKPRRIKGDNNANQRVDIGDATVISRLQVGLDAKRTWDVELNDLNGSSALDSGDVVRALRIVVGMDNQPVATASDTKSLARVSAIQATEAADLARLASSKLNRMLSAKSGNTPIERAEWTLPSVAPVVGQTYRVQISLKDLTNAISGLSMKIKYPVGALRLESAASLNAGSWVPTSALKMWNVGPASTDYVNQNGSVSVAITSQSDWVGTGGVIAELTFRVQAGLTGQATWPIELSEMELTGSGFDIRSLSAVTVQVPGDANAVASRKVSGKVEYYLSTQGGVRGVSLNITEGGGRSAVSAADGTYTIDAPDTGAVTLTPSYATDAPIANGVTTADITLIRRHVLGLTLLDSPYKVMAGDVNGSDSVTTADITLIRRLILGTATTFSGGLWRFVPSDEAFANTAKPWTATRMRQYAALASGTLSGQDFKAIKLGDVNGSWKAPTVTTGSIIKSKAKGRLTVGKVRAEAGKTVNIPVSLAGVNQLGSAQMTLSWDASAASYEGVEGLSLGGLSPENLGLTRVSEGVLSVSWDHPSGRVVDLTGTAGLFQLKLRPKATTAKRIEIRVTEGPTRLELTDGDTEVMAAVDPGWFELGAPGGVGSDSVSLRFVGLSADGMAQLEVRAPEGVKLALETSDSLKSWAEVQQISGKGLNVPVSMTVKPEVTAKARFWRVGVR